MKLLDAIGKLNTWKRKGKTAPHKPLLLLYALERQSRDRNRKAEFEFSGIEGDIKDLLDEFWKLDPDSHRVEDPFWRLQKDNKIWEVSSDAELKEVGSGVVSGGTLRKHNATGCFSQEIFQEIRNDPDVVRQAAHKLLDEYFPESLHAEILERVGLSYEGSATEKSYKKKSRRDPKFRENVLHAYGYSCAVCGFNLQIKTLPVGLEAAHIRWHQYGGPDTEDNGLALCATHHKLLDSGVLTLSDDHRIILSKWVHSPDSGGDFIQKYQKRKIRLPRDEESSPGLNYIRWHRKEVFREPAI